MSQSRRIYVAAGLYVTVALIMTFWLYFQPIAADLVDQFPGPFTPGWETLEWSVPTFCVVMFVLVSGWLVFGGVQKEEARNRRRVR